MSKETMKLALGKIKSARDCHPNAVNTLLFEAEEILEEALAKPDFWEGYVPEPVKPAQQEFVSPGGGYVPAIPAQQALDKKAENARELGLDYEPVCNKDPQGCWNVRCQLGKKCKNASAQQEPVAWTSWRELAGARHYRTPGWEMYADKRNPDDVALYTSQPAQPVQDNPLDCGVYLGSGKGHEIKHHVSYGPEQPMPDAFEQLMREADKPTQVPEGIAKYVDALVKGTHEITSVTIRPKRTWVGLTDEEIDKTYETKVWDARRSYARAIEAKLKEKNT